MAPRTDTRKMRRAPGSFAACFLSAFGGRRRGLSALAACLLLSPFLATSPTSTVIEDVHSIAGESAVRVGAFGIEQAGARYRLARLKALDPGKAVLCRVTHYGGPDFPLENNVSRFPETVFSSLLWAEALGLDGVCAVGRKTPWYDRVRDRVPPILFVDGPRPWARGLFMAVDRIGHGSDVDVYVQDSSEPLFASDRVSVWEVDLP